MSATIGALLTAVTVKVARSDEFKRPGSVAVKGNGLGAVPLSRRNADGGHAVDIDGNGQLRVAAVGPADLVVEMVDVGDIVV